MERILWSNLAVQVNTMVLNSVLQGTAICWQPVHAYPLGSAANRREGYAFSQHFPVFISKHFPLHFSVYLFV
jgi:hypothetical protein